MPGRTSVFALPPIDANVWVEFEGGDPTYRIWTGCFWASGEMPIVPGTLPMPQVKLLQTDSVCLVLNDFPEVGGVSLQCSVPAVATPVSVEITSIGITLRCGGSSLVLGPESFAAIGNR